MDLYLRIIVSNFNTGDSSYETTTKIRDIRYKIPARQVDSGWVDDFL